MIVTNTNNIDNATVNQYIGPVFGEVIEGVNFLKDFAAGICNFVGGRSGMYEESVIQPSSEAINEMLKLLRCFGGLLPLMHGLN
jgi:uncharacterized protein YbjQ (UPF0145 family)